jgi:hypothetical protein
MTDSRKFKFVSPGVFLDEIDNSQLPKTPQDIGPVVIGRTLRGPGLKPVRVSSMAEFEAVFGNPVAGGETGDVWRSGNRTSPMYATYAAQAWLKNSSALTVVRVLGAKHPNATTAGSAGWSVKAPGNNATTNGGAYGLFIMPSGSNTLTATLAAVWYLDAGYIKLQGSYPSGQAGGDGTGTVVKSNGADFQFKAVVGKGAAATLTSSFNLNPNSDLYIRKVFNTDPTLLGDINTAKLDYFLGESFERHVYDTVGGGSASPNAAAGKAFAFILPIANGHVAESAVTAAESGWVIAQDLTSNSAGYLASSMESLFKLVALDEGEEVQRTVKLSISDIKASLDPSNNEYGTFSVLVRDIKDHDGKQKILESFTGCNLNPNSPNFIATKIGDKNRTWDDDKKRFNVYGDYNNQSKYIRVKLSEKTSNGSLNPLSLPFGFKGPTRLESTAFGGTGGETMTGATLVAADSLAQTIIGGGNRDGVDLVITGTLSCQLNAITATFPKISTRLSSSDGGITDPSNASFGFDSTERTTNLFDKSNLDLLRAKPSSYSSFDGTATNVDYQFTFSLDDVHYVSASNGITKHGVYFAGSRAGGYSVTAATSARAPAGSTNYGSYTSVLDAGFDSFTLPLLGGADGLDIKERDPLRNSGLTSATEETNSVFYSLKRAIDTVSDSEVVEMNLASVPGITNTSITDHLITTCEARADSLAVVDLPGGYTPTHESTSAASARQGSTDSIISNLKNRGLNTSYACAFHPWVQVRDTAGAGSLVWMPPSIAALGTFSTTDKKAAPWFAPAGFTRGGLTDGAAGVPVVGVREQLSRKDRDKLYERCVNPIAKFPAEGIVIFGQKTLQTTPSALDRINVRRLMIHVKKGISRIASTLLFTPNVQATWDRFTGQANPFLAQIKNDFGLTDFKVVLDNSTTTADLVDRNIMYAKVLLKPTRSAEFIAIDFTILRSGASFDD